jgi:hypothetical protein
MKHPTIFKPEGFTFGDSRFDADNTRPVVRSFHHKRVSCGARETQGPGLRGEEPVQSFEKGRLLFVGLGELSALKRDLNNAQRANGIIESQHVINICSISVSILRLSIEVEVTNNEPIYLIRHGNVVEPIQKGGFTKTVIGAIDGSEEPCAIIMHIREFNRKSVAILEDFDSIEQRTFPNSKNSPEAPAEGMKQKE